MTSMDVFVSFVSRKMFFELPYCNRPRPFLGCGLLLVDVIFPYFEVAMRVDLPVVGFIISRLLLKVTVM